MMLDDLGRTLKNTDAFKTSRCELRLTMTGMGGVGIVSEVMIFRAIQNSEHSC
jgi:hypothetical protein